MESINQRRMSKSEYVTKRYVFVAFSPNVNNDSVILLLPIVPKICYILSVDVTITDP